MLTVLSLKGNFIILKNFNEQNLDLLAGWLVHPFLLWTDKQMQSLFWLLTWFEIPRTFSSNSHFENRIDIANVIFVSERVPRKHFLNYLFHVAPFGSNYPLGDVKLWHIFYSELEFYDIFELRYSTLGITCSRTRCGCIVTRSHPSRFCVEGWMSLKVFLLAAESNSHSRFLIDLKLIQNLHANVNWVQLLKCNIGNRFVYEYLIQMSKFLKNIY